MLDQFDKIGELSILRIVQRVECTLGLVPFLSPPLTRKTSIEVPFTQPCSNLALLRSIDLTIITKHCFCQLVSDPLLSPLHHHRELITSTLRISNSCLLWWGTSRVMVTSVRIALVAVIKNMDSSTNLIRINMLTLTNSAMVLPRQQPSTTIITKTSPFRCQSTIHLVLSPANTPCLSPTRINSKINNSYSNNSNSILPWI